MNRNLAWLSSLVLMALFAVPLRGQSVFNPDISIIPRFTLATDDGGELPERRVFSRPEFSLEELEIGFQAYVNPYARGDIFLALEGVEEVELRIEEAYVTFLKGLPLDMNIRLGKYRVEFGKLNLLHSHALPFVGSPLTQERFLGPEGLSDLGVTASFILPTGDIYSRLSLDMLMGNSVGVIEPGFESKGGGPGLLDTTDGQILYAQAGRAMTFIPLGDFSDVEIGLSAFTGIHDPYAKLRFWYWNMDFKYKWRPDDYTSLTVWGEALLNTRRIAATSGSDESLRSSGMFIFADYQFQKTFTVGARYDWSQSPYSRDESATAVSVFAGFYPVEESLAIRFQYQHSTSTTAGSESLSINSIILQVMFSLGPHRVHVF
jgi:hypothetical protein